MTSKETSSRSKEITGPDSALLSKSLYSSAQAMPWVPISAALELTLACPHRCISCGSNAGRPRPNELKHPDWLALIDELASLGTQRLSLLGGEPLDYRGWEQLAMHGISLGMAVEMVTSAHGLDEGIARTIAELPLYAVTISVDGTAEIHDAQRRVRGSHRQALQSIRLLDSLGVPVGVTTQLNRRTLPVLEAMGPELESAGVLGWQVQLTLPMGRASDAELTLPPTQMPALLESLRRMRQRRALSPHLTDSIGWFTHDDIRLRTQRGTPSNVWMGCQAGLSVIGITSDGRVKGCLSIPDPHDEGSVRQRSLSTIWHDPESFPYTRRFRPQDLGGACARCSFGRLCRGGCTATAISVSERPHLSAHCLRELVPREDPR